MIWLYERKGTVLRVETTYDNATKEYVLQLTDPGLGPRVERFSDGAAYRHRLEALDTEIRTGEWHLSGTPQIDPEGFPRTRPKK